MQLHLVDALVKGVLVGLFMAVSVGPTLFAVLRYSLNHSYRAGVAFILGVSLSDIMFVIIANVAAQWLEALRDYEKLIAYGASVLLIVVGSFALFRKYKPARPSRTPVILTHGRYFTIWLSGFLINTVNPGVIMSWIGAAAITANTTTLYKTVMFTVSLGIVLSIDFLKVFLADKIRRRLTLRRIMYLQKCSAACIFVIGIALLVSTACNIHLKKNDKDGEAMGHTQSMVTIPPLQHAVI